MILYSANQNYSLHLFFAIEILWLKIKKKTVLSFIPKALFSNFKLKAKSFTSKMFNSNNVKCT